MCLATVDKNLQPCKEGYKVFRANVRNKVRQLMPECQSVGKPLPRGLWLDERDFRPLYMKGKRIIEDISGLRYPLGWHTFHHCKDAREWADVKGVCLKVQVREPKVVGHQMGAKIYPVTVSRYIRIPKQ